MLGKFWKKREHYYNLCPIRKDNEKNEKKWTKKKGDHLLGEFINPLAKKMPRNK
jgi:hypothetical protein